jgi:hypothetical protein
MPLSAAQAIQWVQECGFELLPLAQLSVLLLKLSAAARAS